MSDGKKHSKRNVSIYVDEELADRVEEIASWQNVSVGRVYEINMAEKLGLKFQRLLPRDGMPPEK